ncbi:hypothetical protein ABVS_1117 [Acinetobacter lwoffii]|nr:hypothetical protein ABVS_1117 [Acinetobacter lwoffii]
MPVNFLTDWHYPKLEAFLYEKNAKTVFSMESNIYLQKVVWSFA